jgi:hypothetical protein
VIILDYNITRDQAELLKKWHIRFQRIGVEIGLPSWDDQQEILRWLHRAKQTTFFTRDADFFRLWLCHKNYRDQEKEFLRGALHCPLSLVHCPLQAIGFLPAFNAE